MTVAQELARRIGATAYQHLTARTLACAKTGLLDTLGVAIAGAGEEASVMARRVSGTDGGPALLWGTSERRSALEAAFANGVAANVLDYDDCTDNLGGHPSSPILPALIALAEERRASGREILVAYVAGFETETALGRGVNFHHYEKGWHPTATLGVFGAAAAAARLLRLGDRQIATALALCASLAAGVKANMGAMAKPMHIGHASRSGLLAARLAAQGFTANEDALEHHHGFLQVFNGAGTYSIERMLEKWGTPWDIEMPGIAIKQYPCCLSTQSSVDLMLELVTKHDLEPHKVARVQVATSPRRLAHTDRPQPASALDAKLSVQYVLARALTARAVSLPHFAGDAHLEPGVRAAASLVEAKPMSEAQLRELGDFGAAITITLTDGRVCEGSIGRPVGHAPGVPLSAPLLQSKFEACVVPVLGRAKAAALCSAVQEFENVADVATFTVALRPDTT